MSVNIATDLIHGSATTVDNCEFNEIINETINETIDETTYETVNETQIKLDLTRSTNINNTVHTSTDNHQQTN